MGPVPILITRRTPSKSGTRVAGWQWNWWAVPGLLTAAVFVVLAAVTYGARPGRLQNRSLAVACFAFGIGAAASGGLRFFVSDPATARGFYMTGTVAYAAAVLTFLVFYTTMETPLVDSLRGVGIRATFVAAAIVVPVLFVVRDDLVVTSMVYFEPMDVWLSGAIGPLLRALQALLLVLAVAGIPLAVSAYRQATTPLLRAQAKSFLVASIILDVGFAAIVLYSFLRSEYTTVQAQLINFVGTSLVTLLWAAGLTHGILRAQLFDIRIRLRWTVRRGTVIAIFAAFFLATVDVVQNLLSDSLGLLVGIVATGLLLFAIQPIQRVAERLSKATVPLTEGPDALASRKREVFRSALEGFLRDATLTARERRALQHLQLELGISNAEAQRLESDLRLALRNDRPASI